MLHIHSGFNAVGGNGGLRTQPFVPVDDQMHILPYPSEATPGEAHILPYYPDAKNNAVGVRSLPYPTGYPEMIDGCSMVTLHSQAPATTTR